MKTLILLLLLISDSVCAQKIPDDGFDKIRIAGPDKTIQAELKPVTSDPEMQTDRLYYWYSGNSIHSTQGGFSGRLLNGLYCEYYSNKNLQEMGTYKKGLKDGTWRNWNESGTMTQFYTWEKGIKSGKFNVFDEHGNLKQAGTYHHNLLEGEVKDYKANKITAIVTYHEGVIVPNQPPFWSKVNILKKKDTAVRSTTGKNK